MVCRRRLAGSTRFDSWSGHAPSLHLEIIALRHQLAVVNRSRPPTPAAHALPTGCCGRGSRRHGAAGARPSTSSSRRPSSHGTAAAFACSGPGRADDRTGGRAVPADVRALIRELSTANPLWGAPRIHGELQKLGISVSQSTVAKYMRRHPRPPSQTLADLPHQPREPDHGRRPVRRADGHVPAAVRPRHPRARPSTDRPCGRSPNIPRRPGPHSSSGTPFRNTTRPGISCTIAIRCFVRCVNSIRVRPRAHTRATARRDGRDA